MAARILRDRAMRECRLPVARQAKMPDWPYTVFRMQTTDIIVGIPCLNESATIGKVVEDFRSALPEARIVVLDNGSSDKSAEIARQAGAEVVLVERRGKGQVVRRLLADFDADCWLMVDGDDTYDPGSAMKLIQAVVDDGADMAVGRRIARSASAYRSGHAFGNRLFTLVLQQLFGSSFTDILSGYRAFSRRFAKSFPVLSKGFEIETELTVHALELQMPVAEIPTPYGRRPEGSQSKLSTWKDGWRILRSMTRLFVAERPLLVYGLAGLLLTILSLVLAAPIVLEWLDTGLVPRFPTAILATGLALLGALAFFSGLILDTVTRGRRESKTLAYLRYPAPRRTRAD